MISIFKLLLYLFLNLSSWTFCLRKNLWQSDKAFDWPSLLQCLLLAWRISPTSSKHTFWYLKILSDRQFDSCPQYQFPVRIKLVQSNCLYLFLISLLLSAASHFWSVPFFEQAAILFAFHILGIDCYSNHHWINWSSVLGASTVFEYLIDSFLVDQYTTWNHLIVALLDSCEEIVVIVALILESPRYLYFSCFWLAYRHHF